MNRALKRNPKSRANDLLVIIYLPTYLHTLNSKNKVPNKNYQNTVHQTMLGQTLLDQTLLDQTLSDQTSLEGTLLEELC
jgi:hypothetical protein